MEEQGVSHDTQGKCQLLAQELTPDTGQIFDFSMYDRDDRVSWSGDSFSKQMISFFSCIHKA